MILGIDPGTHCGWALVDDEGKICGCGTWDLSVARHEGGGMRFVRLRRYLEQVTSGVSLVAYEEVRRHAGVSAAHVYGGIVAVIQTICEARDITYTGVPVGSWKKHLVGLGNAPKDTVRQHCVDSGYVQAGTAYDTCDALGIALYASRQWSTT